MISFEGGGRRMTARLIAGEFIRYRSRFPGEFGCRAEVLAEPFIEAVRRVSLVAERASPVRLAFGPGVVVVEAQAEGRARAVETVPAEFEGDEPVISFNPHYLLDGLNAAAIDAPARAAEAPADRESPRQPGGRIRIEFTSPAKPALITWAADPVPVASEPDAGAGAAGQEDPGAVAGEPDAGAGAAGQEDPGAVAGEPDVGAGAAGQEDPGGVAGEPDARARNVAAFRYLVVPLRVPART